MSQNYFILISKKLKLSIKELMLLNCGVGEDSWESLGLQRDQTSQSQRKSVLNVHWKVSCWSWKSNSLATWCEELIHWKRPWCWERLKAGGEGDGRRWDGWMASLTEWTLIWANFRREWRTEEPGMLQSMGPQRVWHKWATELKAHWEKQWLVYSSGPRTFWLHDVTGIMRSTQTSLCSRKSYIKSCLNFMLWKFPSSIAYFSQCK